MALWNFTVPPAVTIPFDRRARWTVWNRVSFRAGSTLIQNPDGSWTQYDVYAPQTQASASNKFLFGPQGFSGGVAGGTISPGTPGSSPGAKWVGAVSSAKMGFRSPIRVYLGGHTYVVSDALRAELVSAVTTQQPGGYGAFVTAASPTAAFTGDEIMKSGHTAERRYRSPAWDPLTFADVQLSQLDPATLGELGVQP